MWSLYWKNAMAGSYRKVKMPSLQCEGQTISQPSYFYNIYSWKDTLYIDMMTSSNGNIFRVTGHLCGEFTGLWWIPRTKASDAELWCFFDLRLNKRLSKQSWGWWFETLSHPLWAFRECRFAGMVNFLSRTISTPACHYSAVPL